MVVPECFDDPRRHLGRPGRGGENAPPKLAFGHFCAGQVPALDEKFFTFEGEGDLIARLQMQGFAVTGGDDQLAFGGKGGGVHAECLPDLLPTNKRRLPSLSTRGGAAILRAGCLMAVPVAWHWMVIDDFHKITTKLVLREVESEKGVGIKLARHAR